MQQALFSLGPGSCPAWALPRVMALVRVLFCLCLDTFAKISERAEGSGQVRRSPQSPNSYHMPLPEHWRWPHLKGGFAGRKWSSGPFYLPGWRRIKTQLPGKCGPLVPSLSSRLSWGWGSTREYLRGMVGGSEEAGDPSRG